MKAFTRVFLKTIIVILIVAVFGGGTMCFLAHRQSTPEYVIGTYLSLLLENDAEEAYAMLDPSEAVGMTGEQYEEALTAWKYSLYMDCTYTELQERSDSDGSEYADFSAAFLDADGETGLTAEITLKKQEERFLGLFDRWKVLPDHCMVKDFLLTVPVGSEVWLDNELADSAWITGEDVPLPYDCYEIPGLLPSACSLVIRHPVLETVNTTLNALDGSADYSSGMKLKDSGQSECLELGIRALKKLYTASVTESAEDISEWKELLSACGQSAEQFVSEQSKAFGSGDESLAFISAAVSEYDTAFGDVQYAEDGTGAITVKMTLSYHYVVKELASTDTGEFDENGSSIIETETVSDSGDNSAVFELAYYDSEWHILGMEIAAIPE